MKCYYHPDKESVVKCVSCSKNLCNECVTVKEKRNYCKSCLERGEYPVDVLNMVFPALICGVVAGFLSAVPVIGMANCFFCFLIILAGGVAVFITKSTSTIKGKISTGKAALTGGLTGLAASVTMWAVLWIGIKWIRFSLENVQKDIMAELAYDIPLIPILIVIVTATGILFTLFGGLGGIIANEMTK
jgi:hypothetical protein